MKSRRSFPANDKLEGASDFATTSSILVARCDGCLSPHADDGTAHLERRIVPIAARPEFGEHRIALGDKLCEGGRGPVPLLSAHSTVQLGLHFLDLAVDVYVVASVHDLLLSRQ